MLRVLLAVRSRIVVCEPTQNLKYVLIDRGLNFEWPSMGADNGERTAKALERIPYVDDFLSPFLDHDLS